MAGKCWRRSARWRGNTTTLYSPLSVERSATNLPLSCSESLTSRDLFAGFTPDISDWEAPGVLKPKMHRASAVPLDGSKSAETTNAHNHSHCLTSRFYVQVDPTAFVNTGRHTNPAAESDTGLKVFNKRPGWRGVLCRRGFAIDFLGQSK